MHQINIEQFHNDLKAALLADVPLVGGKGRRLMATQLENLQQQLETAVHDSQRSIGETNLLVWQNDALPKWYRAALKVFIRTGSMLPVLEGLSVRPLAARDVHRALRWTIVYLLIVASTALLGLLLFELLVVPEIEYFREDLLLPAAIEVTPRFDVLPWLPGIIAVLAMGLVIGLFGIFVGGIANMTSWLGCRRYVCSSISMTVLRVAQSLVRADVAVDDAVSIGYALTGAESNVQRQVESVIAESDDANAIGRMADYMRLIATRRLAHLQIVTPVLLTVALGGGLVLIYCLIVFWPILSLLKDLPIAGV